MLLDAAPLLLYIFGRGKSSVRRKSLNLFTLSERGTYERGWKDRLGRSGRVRDRETADDPGRNHGRLQRQAGGGDGRGPGGRAGGGDEVRREVLRDREGTAAHARHPGDLRRDAELPAQAARHRRGQGAPARALREAARPEDPRHPQDDRRLQEGQRAARRRVHDAVQRLSSQDPGDDPLRRAGHAGDGARADDLLVSADPGRVAAGAGTRRRRRADGHGLARGGRAGDVLRPHEEDHRAHVQPRARSIRSRTPASRCSSSRTAPPAWWT